ncbi:MAG: sporulation initiation factor Spo0A C-terminal domain-containing protein [Candidatus Borkfalkia sp.]
MMGSRGGHDSNTNPDVILLSLILKGIDGFTVLDKLRESGKKYSVIVMGNFANEEIVSTAMSKGAKYYLIKPFAPEVAAARIMELLKNDYSAAGKNISIREKKSTASLDEKISNIFISIGIPPHIKGYNYLREGIKYAVAEPNIINNVTKELYPKIANHFDTTPSKVERAIRHASKWPGTAAGSMRSTRYSASASISERKNHQQRIHRTRSR